MSEYAMTHLKLSRLPNWTGVQSVRGETALKLAKLADDLRLISDHEDSKAAATGAALLVLDCERRALEAAR